MNRLHMPDVIPRYFPEVSVILDGLNKNKEKIDTSAWDHASSNFPSFLLPVRPMVGPWWTTVIKWDSYKSPDLISKDLKDYSIEWIMRVKDNKLIFMPIEEYAGEAAGYDRHPQKIAYDYGFPPELSRIKY